jgi:GTP cyclohydrolase III
METIMGNAQNMYIAIDGDDVGNKLEYFMLTNQLGQLKSFSELFAESFRWLEDTLTDDLDAAVIFSGGDNLLANTNNDDELITRLERLKIGFLEKSGRSLSIGLGATTREAYFALKLAKVSGKDKICHYAKEVLLNE